jgi:hypothetical protein
MAEHIAEPCTAQALRRIELFCLPDNPEMMLWACPICGRTVVHVYATADEYRLFQVESALDGFSPEHRCPPVTCTETECWRGPEYRP